MRLLYSYIQAALEFLVRAPVFVLFGVLRVLRIALSIRRAL